MEITLTPEAVELAQRRGGVMALDFIPPIGGGGVLEVPVDTYVKRKNLSKYQTVEHEGVTIHVAQSLLQWAMAVRIDAERFLFWRKFVVDTQHRHQPT